MAKSKSFRFLCILATVVFFINGISFAAEDDEKDSSFSLVDIAHQITGGIFLGADKGVRFIAYDVIALPGRSVELRADLTTAKSFRDIENAQIGFFFNNQLLDTAVTDDGGRAVVTWLPPGLGDYSIVAQILAPPTDTKKVDMIQVEPFTMLVMVRDANTPFVVIDLDYTLVGSSFTDVLAGRGEPMADSVEVTHRLAQDYSIIYLTHRPEVMALTSRQWLAKQGYPTGVLLSSTMTQMVLGSGRYKTDRLATLAQLFPNLKIGIGDKVSDAKAYLKNRMMACFIPHITADEADELKDAAKEIRSFGRYSNIHVVSSWRQVEAAIYDNQSFPPVEYAKMLEKRAKELEAAEKDD